jgi:hypothetical protein
MKTAWESIVRMLGWVITTIHNQGSKALGKAIKHWAYEAQTILLSVKSERISNIPSIHEWFQGGLQNQLTPESLWTLAGVGRAIPAPLGTNSGISDEYRAWKRRMWDKTAPHDTFDVNVLNDLQKFTKELFLRQKKSNPQREGKITLNTSAALGISREKGGVYQHYMDRALSTVGHFQMEETLQSDVVAYPNYDNDKLDQVTLDHHLPYTHELITIQTTENKPFKEELLLGNEASNAFKTESVINALAEKDLLEFLHQYNTEGRLPRMNPLMLLERGMKYRLATISEAPLVVAGQRLNKRIINLLRNHPSTEYSFSGEKTTPRPIRKGVHAFSRLNNLEFVSADLTAASDYIPHEIAQAVWRGMWEVIGEEFPKHYEQVGQALLGPMILAKEYLTDIQKPLKEVEN